MPHVSKIKLSNNQEKELIRNFDLVLTKITNEDQMNDFLGALFTPTEKIMLAKRLAIVMLLKENVPQAKISSVLKVTQATVSRMQLFLEARGEGYNIAFIKLAKESFFKEFKKSLLGIVKYSTRAAGGYVKL